MFVPHQPTSFGLSEAPHKEREVDDDRLQDEQERHPLVVVNVHPLHDGSSIVFIAAGVALHVGARDVAVLLHEVGPASGKLRSLEFSMIFSDFKSLAFFE